MSRCKLRTPKRLENCIMRRTRWLICIILFAVLCRMTSHTLSTSHEKIISSSARSSAHSGNTRSSSLSMVVPATWADFTCFIFSMLDTLADMKHQPDEYIFVVSGWKNAPDLWNGLDPLAFLQSRLQYPVKLITFKEAQNQARNRNIGAQYAEKDVIFFFDMDDTLSSSSFSIIRNSFNTHLDAVGFIFGHATLERISKYEHVESEVHLPFCRTSSRPCAKNSEYPSDALFKAIFGGCGQDACRTRHYWCCRESRKYDLAPGWLVVERHSLVIHGMYDELYAVGEDGDLIGRLLAQNLNIEFMDIPIGYYNQHHRATPAGCQLYSSKESTD